MFNNLFGKKNDGFYVQVEDDNNSPKPEAKAKPAAESANVAAVAPVATTQAAPATKSDVKVDKPTATTKKKTEAKKPEATPAPVVASAPAAPPINNFATDYLIEPARSSSRRFPGANMSMFMDMARQVKIPVSFKK